MLSNAVKVQLRPFIPPPALRIRQKLRTWWRERPLTRLERSSQGTTTREQRRSLVTQIREAETALVCAHTPAEMARIISAILSTPPSVRGAIVEAGCFKGGSTAKLSLAARLAGRRLIVFDSFAGLPDHDEQHGRTIFGDQTNFYSGRYEGRLEEVQANVGRYGAADVCEWKAGWFEDTMPGFAEPVAVAFIDVDLASSTRTCLKHLYPRLVPGGSVFSHDGHLPLVLDVLRDDAFWRSELGVERPPIPGLGRQKLLQITKPRAA